MLIVITASKATSRRERTKGIKKRNGRKKVMNPETRMHEKKPPGKNEQEAKATRQPKV